MRFPRRYVRLPASSTLRIFALCTVCCSYRILQALGIYWLQYLWRRAPGWLTQSLILTIGLPGWILGSLCLWHYYRHYLYKPTRAKPVVRNWDGRYTLASPTNSTYYPKSLYEVVQLVRQAKSSQRRLKVVGAGHSWNDIAKPHDIHVNLDNLNKIVEVDAANRRVTVEAGIRLCDLYSALDRLDPPLAFPNVPSVDEQSIAGAICTNTHGSGARHEPLSRQVISLEVVDAKGKVHTINQDMPGDLLNAFRISLGCLGIITKVTLELVPAFDVKVREHLVTENEFYEKLSYYINSFEFAKFWILPHTNSVVVYEISKAPSRQAGHISWTLDGVIKGYLMELVQFISASFPPIQRVVNEIIGYTSFLATKTRSGKSYEHLQICYRVPYHTELEYAVPASKAVKVIKKLQNYIATSGIRCGFIHEIRFVQRDNSWLSSGYLNKDSEKIRGHNGRVPDLLTKGEVVCHITIGLFSASEEKLRQYFRYVWSLGSPSPRGTQRKCDSISLSSAAILSRSH
eukprot:gb/GECG01010655.1/.p1 GENE.gb/GECG01010655.1/~~gb/GECG01010655.1/.p1  ORF type:complete len:515 (+),score=14.16 gb/GECG01010655.1/:1-1545(+)